MQEFELQHIWDNEDEAAGIHYSTISSKVERLARQKSANILHKILRNSKMEIYATILLSVTFFFFFDELVMKGVFLIAGVGSIWFASDLYQKLRTSIHEAIQYQTVDAIQTHVITLDRYIKRLRFYCDVFMPISFAVGIIGAMLRNYHSTTMLEFLQNFMGTFLIATPLLLLMIWSSKKYYIQWLYGKHRDSLQELLTHLKASENIHE